MMQRRSDDNRLSFDDGVRPLAACSLKVRSDFWPFAEMNAAAIDAHWAQASQTNPGYFNGVVHLVEDMRFDGDRLDASLVKTDFKSYLLWRNQGFPEAGVLDGFGSALIRSSDGHMMLGRQRQGNINAGLAYPPSGFIDERDVQSDGSIDIAGSVAREVSEETGVDAAALVRDGGFYLTRSGAQLSIAVPFQVSMAAAEFVRVAERHIALSSDSELDAIIPVAGLSDIKGLSLPRYARVLLEALLAESSSSRTL
jgi:hypothetical protein